MISIDLLGWFSIQIAHSDYVVAECSHLSLKVMRSEPSELLFSVHLISLFLCFKENVAC